MASIEKARQELLELLSKSKHERMLVFSSIFTELLATQGLRPIIVGGLSVEIYTTGDYTTRDIDYILADRNAADNILKKSNATLAKIFKCRVAFSLYLG